MDEPSQRPLLVHASRSVQRLPSLQAIPSRAAASCTHPPCCASQYSRVQGLLSMQEPAHTPVALQRSSSVQMSPSSQAVLFGLNAFAGHVAALPEQFSALSHTPT